MPEDTSKSSPLSQSCPDCGAVLDVSSEEPFAQVRCPMCGTAMRTRSQFNNFMLEMQLGVGGMGAVYKALDVTLNRLVALKVVLKEYSSDPAYHAKFEHEARTTALVNHPHVVKVYSFGSDHGLFYIAMELVDGGSLDELINQEGRLSEARVLETGIQIAQGLNAALKRGLIHRDVKPGNILYADAHTAKIVDFGLALPMERGAESKHGEEVWGTPYYIAPEKLTYEPEDFRSDIYSLGASLFHAIAGRPCFEGETTSLSALRQLKSKPVNLEAVLPGVSSATAYVINRTLCVDPKDRHQSYEELIEHLNYARTKLLEKGTKSHLPKIEAAPGEIAAQKKKSALIKIAGTVAVAAVLLILLNRTLHHQPPQPVAVAEPVKKPKVANLSGEDAYLEGRKQLIAGNFSAARDIFREMSERQNLPHPLDRWVLLHEGLSGLLDGNLNDSRAAFRKLVEKGVYSDAPEDRALANFFIDTARPVALGQTVSGDVAKDFNAGDSAALGLFVLALNDWEMSQFDDAEALFQAFLAANPKPPYEWVAEYKPLAEKYSADFAAYKKMAAGIDATGGDLQKEKQALEDLQALKASLQVPGRLPEKLESMDADLQKKIAAAEAEEKKHAEQMALRHDQDAKTLAAAKEKYDAFLTGYQYAEAQDAIAKTEITDPAFGLEKANLLKKAQWLAKFKETLINDINTTGYPLPVSKINSAPIEGGVYRATQQQIEIQTKYGAVDVLWTELPAPEILSLAGYFTGKVNSADVISDRQWLSGVFAMANGMPKQAKGLLEMASQSRPEYREQMALFQGAAQ